MQKGHEGLDGKECEGNVAVSVRFNCDSPLDAMNRGEPD